jgi:hypothetical protein
MDESIARRDMDVLAFPIDTAAVLKHLLQDMRDDWFVDPIQHRDLFSDKESLRKVLHELLVEGNGQYQAALRNIYDIPKKGLGIRYSLETDFYDRFIYQAICSFLIPYYDPILSHRVLSHRYNKNRHSEKYLFKPRIDMWQTFEGVTKTALSNNQALLATDLINYFENIAVELIRTSFESKISQISASGPEKVLIRNAINTLCELMSHWGYSDRHGLPQNRDASSFIANVVIDSVDKEMIRLGYDYYRYVDDIRIICVNPATAKKALIDLIKQLRTVSMNINSGKSMILTSKSDAKDIDTFFPASDDRSQTIDNMWKSRSRRVISRSVKYIYQILKESIDSQQTQSRQFRFAVNRLIRLSDANLFDIQNEVSADLKDILIETLDEQAVSTDQYCRLLSQLNLEDEEFKKISDFLSDSSRAISPWQNFHLWLLFARKKWRCDDLLRIAVERIEENILQPEVSSIFIYLRSVGEENRLHPFIEKFKSTWPYYHQRSFLLATSRFDPEYLKPLLRELGPKLKGTIHRAQSFIENGLTLELSETVSLLNIYDELSPYE